MEAATFCASLRATVIETRWSSFHFQPNAARGSCPCTWAAAYRPYRTHTHTHTHILILDKSQQNAERGWKWRRGGKISGWRRKEEAGEEEEKTFLDQV